MCVIEGWMLDESGPKFEEIAKRYGTTAVAEDVKFDHHEMPPTVLDNPRVRIPKWNSSRTAIRSPNSTSWIRP